MRNRVVLICTVGKTPPVLTETVWALAHECPPVIPDEIIAVTTNAFANRACEAWFGKSGGWRLLLKHLKREGISIDGKLNFGSAAVKIVDDGVRFINDLRTVDDNLKCADCLFGLVKTKTDGVGAESTIVIMSMSGGRKSMAGMASSIMSLLARPQDRLLHVIVEDRIERDKRFHFPEKGKGFSLFDVPFVRTRGLLRRIDMKRSLSFTECLDLTQGRVPNEADFPIVLIDATKGCVKVNGGMTLNNIDGARFLFLWLLFKNGKFDRDQLRHQMCMAHAMEIDGNLPSWLRRFRGKSDKFQEDSLEDFRKVINETKKSVLRKAGLTWSQICALYPHEGNANFDAAELLYPRKLLKVVDSALTQGLYTALLDAAK